MYLHNFFFSLSLFRLPPEKNAVSVFFLIIIIISFLFGTAVYAQYFICFFFYSLLHPKALAENQKFYYYTLTVWIQSNLKVFFCRPLCSFFLACFQREMAIVSALFVCVHFGNRFRRVDMMFKGKFCWLWRFDFGDIC